MDKASDKFNVKLSENLNVMAELVQDGFLRNLAKVSAEIFDQLAQDMTQSLSTGINEVLEQSKTVGEALRGLFDSLKSMIRKAVSDMIAEMMRMYVIQPMMQNIFGGLFGAAGGSPAKGSVGSVLGGLFRGIGGFFAEGGDPPVGKPSIVGENGPEIFIPKVPGTIYPNGTPPSGGGGNNNNNTYVYAPQVSTAVSKDEVFAVLDRHSREFFQRVQSGIQNDKGIRDSVKSV